VYHDISATTYKIMPARTLIAVAVSLQISIRGIGIATVNSTHHGSLPLTRVVS
jgi:uncharacterized protein (DUF4213/DUF364 family)